MFSVHLDRWRLTPDGEPIITSTSRLLPVRAGGVRAMLKLTVVAEEKHGGQLMRWWNGRGAARVLACEDGALLMERAVGGRSLAQLARAGSDEEASQILCATVANLHAPRPDLPPELTSLDHWFSVLVPTAQAYGGIFRRAAAAAGALLAQPQDLRVLHGDIHHGNVLDFGERGWLAIDPKGLFGERAFDYANLFCNPDPEMATLPNRLARQLNIVSEAADLDRSRLAQWVLAWAGLSAAFQLQDGLSPEAALQVAELAAADSV